MYTDTAKEMLDSILELEELKAQLEQKKGKQPVKSKINYLFTQKTVSKIKEISNKKVTDGFSESEIARAAMYIGLKELEKAIEKDKNHIRGLLHIARLKSKFQ